VGEKHIFSPQNKRCLGENTGLNLFHATINDFESVFLYKKQAFVGEIPPCKDEISICILSLRHCRLYDILLFD
jgi:hypothetical protein